MKDYVRMIKSFVLFESPLQVNVMQHQFATIQDYFQQQYPYWSFMATRKKLIYNFWLRHVGCHFLLVVGIASLVIVPTINDGYIFLASIILGGLMSLFSILLFRYWPAYYADFLPKLDTIIAEQELIKMQEAELKKCKRSQFSIPALSIIFYVFCKATVTPTLPGNDNSAELLNGLFGADKDKLKQNLSRLYKISSLSVKERAEMQKGIDTARNFFMAINLLAADNILDQLELKMQKNN